MLVTTPRMRPLLLSEVFPPQVGGSGRWLFEVYRRLPRRAVIVVAGDSLGACEFDETHELAIRRFPLTFGSWGFFESRGFQGYWQAFQQLAQLVAEEQPRNVHC